MVCLVRFLIWHSKKGVPKIGLWSSEVPNREGFKVSTNIKGCVEAVNAGFLFNEIEDGMFSEEGWELVRKHLTKIEAIIEVLEKLEK